MLLDGVLTREEKRLIIKLASLLELKAEEPAMAYAAIQEGEELSGGKSIDRQKQLKVYEKIYEVALLNESLSQDEWRVIRYIKELFDISDSEDKKVLDNIKSIN